MTHLNQMTPQDVKNGLSKGHITLIDIRESDEYAREHIKEALHLPLSIIAKDGIEIESGKQIVFHCRSGHRTDINCEILSAQIDGEAWVMTGGLNAWKTAELPVINDKSAPMEINRQVQITAGLLTLLGAVLGFFIHPGLFVLSGFIGAGLTFSGLSGSCAMGRALMWMPWNRKAVM